MHRKAVISPAALMMVGGLSACTPPEPANLPTAPTYEGVRTTLLDGDLVEFDVTIRDARGPTDIEDYARCAAAQYALIRGYGFARHLRTNMTEKGWCVGGGCCLHDFAIPAARAANHRRRGCRGRLR